MKSLINIDKAQAFERYAGQYQIGESFCDGGDKYLVVTPEQATSFKRVVEHQGKDRYEHAYLGGFCGDYYLAVKFTDIMIGIEPDGYAHS